MAGSIAAAFVFVVAVGSAPSPSRQQVLEATVRMERLAVTLGRALAVQAETADQIANLMQRPQYDCAKLGCDPATGRRNRAARAQLQSAIFKRPLREETAATDLIR